MRQLLREAAEDALLLLATAETLHVNLSNAHCGLLARILREALTIPDPPAVEWIDVNHRTPDNGRVVIIAMDRGTEAGYFDKRGWHSELGWGGIMPVTHWAEFPKGPSR